MSAPPPAGQMRVAVVGGGLAGLTCATQLLRRGAAVTVFDSGSRGPGGRASTKETSGYAFDYGCQFLRPTTDAFRELLREWESAGFVQRWQPRLTFAALASEPEASQQAPEKCSQEQQPGSTGFCGLSEEGVAAVQEGRQALFCGRPAMGSVCRGLADTPGLTVRSNTKVTAAHRSGGTWRVSAEGGGREPGRGAAKAAGSIEEPSRGADGAAAGRQAPNSRGPGSEGGRVEPGEEGTGGAPGTFDVLVLADEITTREGSPQAIDLGAAATSPVVAKMQKTSRTPLLALQIAFKQPLLPQEEEAKGSRGCDAAVVSGSRSLQWVSCCSAKSGQQRSDGAECWVAVTTADFAKELLEGGQQSSGASREALPAATPQYLQAMQPRVWEAFREALPQLLPLRQPVPEPALMRLQRWGGALKQGPPNPAGFLWDEGLMLGACGDFCSAEGYAEGAALSGLRLAERLGSPGKS